ncbi:hypothetical protein [Algivirga pacifica]|uniref:Bacteriocin-type signal sequence-containing protein n=1 Tax=Algivirga pacifica TaxID=1162670 RepID=A0ABP9DL49_9BACT
MKNQDFNAFNDLELAKIKGGKDKRKDDINGDDYEIIILTATTSGKKKGKKK